jgi:hypothetical protein
LIAELSRQLEERVPGWTQMELARLRNKLKGFGDKS